MSVTSHLDPRQLSVPPSAACAIVPVSLRHSSHCPKLSKVIRSLRNPFDTQWLSHQCKCMPGVFHKLGVSVAVLCILLMLMFLTVREQGQFSAAFVPGTGLIAQRAAVPEQISLLLAALVIATLASPLFHMFHTRKSSVPIPASSQWYTSLSCSRSTLRC